MMLPVKFHPEAEFDLQEALLWYGQQKIGLDAEFMLCVDEAIVRIQRSPTMFPIVLENVRKTLVRRFPYILYYEVGTEEIMILAVFHAKRHPTHWQQRLSVH